MEKTKKHKKHREGSQDPLKSNDGKGGQVLVDVPASSGVSMDFAKNMKSAAVELKRMSLTNSNSAEVLHGRPKPPASPRGLDKPEVMHALPQSNMERHKQLQDHEEIERQMHAQKSPRMRQFDQQQRPQASPHPSPQPEQQQLNQISDGKYDVRGQMPSQQGQPAKAPKENFEVGSSDTFASNVSPSKGQVKYQHQQQLHKQQMHHKQAQQLQGQVASAASLAHANGHFGRGPPYDSLQGFTDMGSVLDGMTCPSCGSIKGTERLDLCQLRDAAEELRSQLADLSLQFAKEQNREAAECRRLRGLLEGDARYKHEFNASRGNNAEVQDLRSELNELKRQFRSQVADLREQLSGEEMESQRLREKLQREEMRRGR
eukprot:gnl/MRDRNA2_/MRDRNA2_130812_c0_seq1.p1 gnl/MRDRNA2_/MRDRNA2_130812_c0~~gnl/MRDRNA2_/MRDRNA2_130812_c0_seq1.p1  ORF type:complete len:374 (+),score=100.32 gnl/MRDRNA2_/MRDRNA2_130812_c0_seq1:42-1163(+)